MESKEKAKIMSFLKSVIFSKSFESVKLGSEEWWSCHDKRNSYNVSKFSAVYLVKWQVFNV